MCDTSPCYPVETAGRCMSRAETVALGVFTLAVVALWLPFGAAGWLWRRIRG